MKLKHFIRLSALLLLCCATFVGKGKNFERKCHDKGAKLSVKALNPNDNLPENYSLTYNLFENNQVITQQVHKTVHSVHVAYLLQYSFTACLKYLNFFSGNNNQGHSLSKKILLFPFHVFW